MRFTKMQGLGNDYLYVLAKALPENAPALSRRLSDRHFGPGADGMIWMLPSDCADIQMRIFNADGSEAQMCGNGIRCVGKYLYDRNVCRKPVLSVETLCGVKTLRLYPDCGVVRQVAVDMGRAHVEAPEPLELLGRRYLLYRVDMGNPHAVLFSESWSEEALHALGPAIQTHPLFPGGVNLELATRLGPNHLRMRVWERGSGVTLACGTGACAASAAAVLASLCSPDTEITLELDGGCLTVRVDRQWNVTMTGPAEFVYDGIIEL